MIERVGVPCARRVLSIVRSGEPEHPACGKLFGAAGDDPLIVGWDAARQFRKLYLNLSDTSRSRRKKVAAALELPDDPRLEDGAHVIGVNLTAGRATWKFYVQSADRPSGDDALDALRKDLPVAGVVEAFDVSPRGTLRTRARFLAPREDHAIPWARVRAATGASHDALEGVLPHPVGLVRSMGRTTGGDWTVYVKPPAAEDHLAALEPVACFARDHHEVGVFVTEATAADRSKLPRAYARTERFAISYRVRRGDPGRDELEALMRWVLDRVRQLERTNADLELAEPPAPWSAVRA